MLILYGGDGFIGRHLSATADAAGVPFTVISRHGQSTFLRSHAPTGQAMSLEDFDGPRGETLLESASALVHLAWATVPGTRLEDPTDELDVNVRPAWRCFRRALTVRPGLPIVFLSSGGTAYGDTGTRPAAETAPLAPRCAYGAGKLMGETALRQACAELGGQARILRPSNPVGRWQRRPDQGIVAVAAGRMLGGEPVTIFGDGGAVRDYLDADDLADAVLAAAVEPRVSGTWNIGSGEGRTTLEVVRTVAARLNTEPRLVFAPDRACDVRTAVLDSTAFRDRFGWRPRRTFSEAVARAVSGRRGGAT